MSRPLYFKFRLYIAGETENSGEAMANIKAICRTLLPDRHEIEIVDVFREPKMALADGVFMTPTLLKLMPFPRRRIIGTLNPAEPVLHALGLEGDPA